MIAPGTRQLVARIIDRYIEALMRPSPEIVPMASPCLPGFLSKRQAM